MGVDRVLTQRLDAWSLLERGTGWERYRVATRFWDQGGSPKEWAVNLSGAPVWGYEIESISPEWVHIKVWID